MFALDVLQEMWATVLNRRHMAVSTCGTASEGVRKVSCTESRHTRSRPPKARPIGGQRMPSPAAITRSLSYPTFAIEQTRRALPTTEVFTTHVRGLLMGCAVLLL